MRRALAGLLGLVVVGSVAAVSAVMAQGFTPTLTLSPSCGSIGATITVSGLHFAPGSSGFPITVTFDPGGKPVSSVQVAAGSIDAQGNFTTALTVPSRQLRSAPYVVVANQTTPAGGTEASARAQFNLPCTTLIVDPTCGSVGAPITVHGTGFQAGFPVTISFTPPAGGKPDATVQPADDTTFTTVVPVPDRPPGNYVVVAVQQSQSAFAAGQLTARAEFQVPCVKAAIVLKPTVGPPGTVVTVIGTGFPPGAAVRLSWNQGIQISIPSIAIDATQGFQLELLIYAHDELGLRVMSAGPDLSVPTAPLFNIATADFLVVPGTEQPHDFSWRR